MANFFATYSAASNSSSTVTALQGTVPWVVTGDGVPGTPQLTALTIQGNASGVPIPISGSITATNPSVSATGSAVPASGTYIAASVGGTLTGLVATANGLKTDVTASVLPTGAATEATLSAASSKLPATLGQKAMAASMAVAIASDQSAVPVSGSVTVSGTVTANQGGAPWSTTISGTPTISGTVAATQSGTWTVQPGNTANTTAWLVTQATTTAVWQAEGSVAFGSVTNTYATVFTPAAATKIIQMRNNCNAAISVSLDGGSTTNYVLDSGDQVSIDFRSNLLVAGTSAIQIKYTVGAPTSGSFRVNACS